MTSQLVGSSFANGALLPNYVNGRLLAAEDLATGQSTLLRRDTWIGQAAGSGIVTGLEVTATATTLTVAGGLGITPSGEPVSLPAPITLPLSIAGAPAAPAGGSFANCTAATSGSQAAVTTGAYLLTAMPTCQPQGQAPMAVPPGSDTPVACTAQWQAEGVQFKAIPLPLGAAVDGITVTPENSRNLLAHWCFGTALLAALGVNPFSFSPAYRGLDQLASTDLTPCDLPLGVFWWDAGTITFADNWSARRRMTRPDVSGAPWSAAVADQRSADGEARFLQFQDQVSDLMAAGASGNTVAADVFFGLLPPVGFLPVAFPRDSDNVTRLLQTTDATPSISEVAAERPIGALSPEAADRFRSRVSQLSPQPGFWPPVFLGGLARFGGYLTWDTAYFALRQSYFAGPVATAPAGEDAEAVITYYLVIENYSAWQGGEGTTTATPLYAVFVKNQLWPPGNRPPFVIQQAFVSER
ncbi:MAG: hypothetical protein ABSF03_23280 [Streptosporangiaceae bacterium]